MSERTPREIVAELDHYIVGQGPAKRAVAIALRNRWRRMQLDPSLRDEVMPKNILMIGPTGVGKTEIARRLAALANAPFVKVEVNRFTEVGHAGRDVEQIIRDLAESAVKMFREQATARHLSVAAERAESRLIDALLPKRRSPGMAIELSSDGENDNRNKLRRQLRAGELEQSEVELELGLPASNPLPAPVEQGDMDSMLRQMIQNQNVGSKRQRRTLSVAAARVVLADEEAALLVNEDEIRQQALEACEQNGIVFIDEIDKVCQRGDSVAADVSREIVQRDLLPLVEGAAVSTRYGTIRTDHILFIASGAFRQARPADLIPELQGRFPIRVELSALGRDDFRRILTEPRNALTRQYMALLATEGVEIDFDAGALDRLAEIAFELNQRQEDIGARRLHTVLEKLLETLNFEASERAGSSLLIDRALVDAQLGAAVQDPDPSRYLL